MSQSGPDSVAAGAARLRAWLETRALPFWASVGVADDGGFYERLSLDGRPVTDAVRRLRVQARQIYVFSHASALGLGDWRTLALKGFEWLIRYGYDPKGGGFVHKLGADGTAHDTRKDTYDHAFVLLALAWLSRATGEAAVREWIGRVSDFLDTWLKAPDGAGYLEGRPPSVPRRQNPHMHLLEATLALHGATGEQDWLARSENLVALFRDVFFNRELVTVTEYFDEGWKPLDGEAGRVAEPGHHFEWAVLLNDYAQRAGVPVPQEAQRLFDTTCERGMEVRTGLAYDEIWNDGSIRKATKRCWPQTEAIRAHAIFGHKRPGLVHDVRELTDALFTYYLDPAPPGTWIDMRGPGNEPAADTIPASTLYHLMSAYATLGEQEGQTALGVHP